MQIRKIFFVFAIALVIFLLIVPFVSYKTFKGSIRHEVFRHLVTARQLLRSQVENYFNERFGDVDVLARNPIIAQSFTQLATGARTSGVDGTQYSTILRLYKPLMEHYLKDYGYVNIYFVTKEGDVVFEAVKSEYNGQNLIDGDYKGYSISTVFSRGLEEVAFEDYTWHEEREEFTSYFSAPVFDKAELLGVIVIEVPFSHLDVMMTHKAGLGKTGEMYLVGDDGYMRSNSRFSEEPTILTKEVDTEATREAFNGHLGTKIVKDYRDVWVLSAYAPINLKFVDWVLIVEIDKKEAFASIRFVEIWLIVIGVIIGIIASTYIYLTNKIEKKQKELEVAKRAKHAKNSA